MASAKAEIEDILNQLQTDHGWRIEQKKGHPVLFPPNRSLRPMTISMTPGTHNWRNTLNADLRRRGFDLRGTTVRPMAATSVAAATTQKAALTPPAREDPKMSAPALAQPHEPPSQPPDSPGPDAIVSVEPSIIPGGGAEGGFPGRTTDKVMTITYGDGRQVFECAGCGVQKDNVHKVMYHLRSHTSRATLAASTPPVEQVDAATDAIAEARERAAVEAAQYEHAGRVIDGQSNGTAPALVVVEPPAEEPAVPEADVVTRAREAFTTLTSLMSTLIETAEKASEQVAAAKAAVEDAEERARKAEGRASDAEQEAIEARRRVHEVEARLTQAKQALGVLTAA